MHQKFILRVYKMNTGALTNSNFHHPESKNKLPSLDLMCESLKKTLDSALGLEPWHAMEYLRSRLFRLHKSIDKSTWKTLVDNVVIPHQTMELCHKDPFTYRAFKKPRGYAGDAVMIDYAYGFNQTLSLPDNLSVIVNKISFNSPSVRAVRNRLYYIVNRIDEIAQSKKDVEILSVACGHCRELSLVQKESITNLTRFVAFDQDPESISLIEQEYGSLGISTQTGSVTRILKNRGPENSFDFIYALGLYDYLGDRLAQSLTAKLFSKLKSDGELVVANFQPDILDVGYMESYMAWELIFRDLSEMSNLLKLIHPEEIKDFKVFNEPEKNINFISIVKK